MKRYFLGVLVGIVALTTAYSLPAGSKGKTALKNGLKSDVVKQTLEEPDGCAIIVDGMGGWKIYAIGTGSYDFNDRDDEKDALTEATLQAKAHIAKFLHEKVTSDESVENITQKSKQATKGQNGTTRNISKKSVKTITTKLRSQAEAILKGVVVLETETFPNKDDEGGEIRVKVGVSSKTISMANRIGQEMSSGNSSNAGEGSAHGLRNSKKKKRKSKTIW